MKKFAALSLSLMMMISNVFANEVVTVKLDNETINFENQPSVVSDGRAIIPAKDMFIKLGYTPDWIADTKTLVLKKENTTIKFTENADSFECNGELKVLDTPAKIINGVMMVPLRAVSQSTGMSVSWDNTKKFVVFENENSDKTTIDNAEIQKFYDDLKCQSKISAYMYECTYNSISTGIDIMKGVENKTLASTKAVELLDSLNDYYNTLYNMINTYNVTDDYKTSKGLLLDRINDLKKSLEYEKNYFNNVYPNREAYEEDIIALYEVSSSHSELLSSELAKLNNQYMRTMYKYFDTDKDTEENKKLIAEFTEKIDKIDTEYPIPTYEDIYDEDDKIIVDNIDKNVEMLRNAYKNREAAYNNLSIPENCNERLQLIMCSNEILNDMADNLEKYKDQNSAEYNPYSVEVKFDISVYDLVSTLASDGKLKRINFSENEEYDFEIFDDDEYTVFEFDDVSEETLDFVNTYFSLYGLSEYMDNNDMINSFNGMELYDDENTQTTKNVKTFFDSWISEQNENIENLKSFKIYEKLKDLKSAIINYLLLDVDSTKLLKDYYTKTITDEQYDTLSDDLDAKLDVYEKNCDDEISRVNLLIQNYCYDYLDLDSVRTEYSEIGKFGKNIEEINEKYPIIDYSFYLGYIAKDELTATDVNKFSDFGKEVVENINKRKEEYNKLDVSSLCEKRLELVIAANNIVLECAEDMQKCKANDKGSRDDIMSKIHSSMIVYYDFLDLAYVVSDDEDSES